MIRRGIRVIGPLVLWTALSLSPTSSLAQNTGQQCNPQGQSGGCCLATGVYAPAGSPCNDGNPRTVDSCNATGICVGVYPPAATCASGASYNQQTGACVANSRLSPTCGDGNVDPGEQCDNGSKCGNGTDCTGNPGVCGDGSCHPAAGNCCSSSCTYASAGTTCDDGNSCTPTDTCDGNGSCVGSGQVNCDGSDACHPNSNFCSPATGSCSTCGDPNNAQDKSYCSADTGECVSNVLPCPQYEIDAQGNQNLCHTNSGQDPNTGECIYQPKLCAPIHDDCNLQVCQSSTGQCVTLPDPNCLGACTEPTFPDTPCFSGSKCVVEGCAFDPLGLPNCNNIVTAECGANANSCEVALGCNDTTGCVFQGVACAPPTNPCQEIVRTPEASTCCTYQARDCAVEFGNNPNYLYSCDPTPGTGGCRALLKQTITFNPIAQQVVGGMVPLSATASSNLSVTFKSLTQTVCSVNGTSATMLAVGTCVIEADQAGNTKYAMASPVTQSFVVSAPVLTTTMANAASGQYSDPVTLSAVIGPSGATFSGALQFQVAGANACSVSVTGSGTYTCSYTITQAAGTYTIAATLTPTNSSVQGSSGNNTLTVTKEDATVTPSSANPATVQVNAPGGTAGPISLIATVQQVQDGSLGNITNAVVTVTLLPAVPGGATVACPVTSTNGALTATCSNVPVDAYTVQWSIAGNYYQGPTVTTMLAVYDPSLGSVTGAGSVMDNGSTADFAIAVKYLKNGTLSGGIIYIERRAKRFVTVISTKLTSMSLVGTTAIIYGQATVNGLSGYTLQLNVTDNETPGINRDTFGLQLSGGTLSPPISFAPAKITAGNIEIH